MCAEADWGCRGSEQVYAYLFRVWLQRPEKLCLECLPSTPWVEGVHCLCLF